jgi:hypothetical protein
MPTTSELLAPIFSALWVAIPILLALLVLQIALGGGKRKRAKSKRSDRDRRPSSEWKAERAAEQVRSVEESGFERKPLLNREEALVLPVLEDIVQDLDQGHRVMAQTSLGEVIRPKGRDSYEAFAAINSKRLDFAIFDRQGLIVCAVEYQGSGHYQGSAALRDTVKREALRKAGVRMLEVYPDFSAAELQQEVWSLLNGAQQP